MADPTPRGNPRGTEVRRRVAAGESALRGDLASTTTILFTDQSVAFALHHARRAYILQKGQVAYAGTTAELRETPDLQERYLSVA
ncbi:MAG: hypothetical protein R3215_05120 [Halomonas sp.]|nr:hypothetical protein [Halomonas sp.]